MSQKVKSKLKNDNLSDFFVELDNSFSILRIISMISQVRDLLQQGDDEIIVFEEWKIVYCSIWFYITYTAFIEYIDERAEQWQS